MAAAAWYVLGLVSLFRLLATVLANMEALDISYWNAFFGGALPLTAWKEVERVGGQPVSGMTSGSPQDQGFLQFLLASTRVDFNALVGLVTGCSDFVKNYIWKFLFFVNHRLVS